MGVLLLSGGIDSPVAGYLLLARGASLVGLYMDSGVFTDEATRGKVRRIAEVLARYGPFELWSADHEQAQRAIARGAPANLWCVLCRRQMYRAAAALAGMRGASFIVTGESLGQVASQTLDNLAAESDAAPIPVVRPLIGLDKQEIRAIGERIGTYPLSILPGMCCSLAPEKPATRVRARDVRRAEADLAAQFSSWGVDGLLSTLTRVSP